MSMMRRNPLWVVMAGGLAVRLVLAFAFVGPGSDIAALQAMGDYLGRDPLHAYALNDQGLGGRVFPIWPYPPAYFLWLACATGFSDITGLPFHGVVQLLPIAADVGLAFAIYTYLGWRGAPERLRLAGAVVIMLGPSFIATSGYHGQIDGVAILPGVLALMAWERRPRSMRATDAGLLVGLGAAIKTVPGFLVLPLFASARSTRERARLIATAVAVPAIIFLPFFVADPGAIEWLGVYRGFPGKGGLSLALDPSLGWNWVAHGAPFSSPASGVGELIVDNSAVIGVVTLAAVAAFLLRYRPAPVDGAVLLWLAIYAFTPNFFMQYLIWGLPFFIMAGYLREVAIVQVALVPATVIYYAQAAADRGDGLGAGFAALYVVTMVALWGFWTLATFVVARRIVRQRASHAEGVQPPLIDIGVRRHEPTAATP